MKNNFFLLLAVCFLIFENGFSQSEKKLIADKKNSVLAYSMKHPMHDWTANCKNFSAAIVYNESKKSIEQIAVVARADAFDSGNGNRDSHAIEAIEALKYPKIVFKSTAILQQEPTILRAEGFLTFHGITQKVSLLITKKNDSKQLITEGNFVIKLTDYYVEPPSLLGIKAENELKISFKVVFSQETLTEQ
jgi:polyisoprenoid-binding protein YceI